MKKVNLSKFMKLTWIALLGLAFIVSSCKKDPDPVDPPAIVLDGVYVKGAGTALTDFDAKGLMKVTPNEVTKLDKASLKEIYIAVKAGAEGFNIVTVAGSTQKVMGPGSDFALVAEADLDAEEPRDGLWRGSIVETATKFTVPEDGLYHVVYDSELGIVVMAKAVWGIIGGATPGGWGANTPFPAPAFNLNTMTYTIPSVTMGVDSWKFRYSNGWKIILDPTYNNGTATAGLKVNTNFGGAISALVPGGGDMLNGTYANYKITLTYTLGSPITATFAYESDAVPLPEYPEAMYVVGAGTAYGWPAADPAENPNAAMHKVAGGAPSEGIYWKICHLEAGQGFKVTAAGWSAPNLGFAEVDEYDANGFQITDNGGNMSVAASGMYMIVLNLRDSKVKLSFTEVKVYGIGDAFTDYTEDVPANLFVVDNGAKTVTSPALPTTGNIRMYADHAWIPAWWNAEFNVFNGVIEYRNDGGDQAAVAGTAGNVVTLSFDDNTGTIQ